MQGAGQRREGDAPAPLAWRPRLASDGRPEGDAITEDSRMTKHAAIHQYALVGIATILAFVMALAACADASPATPTPAPSAPTTGWGERTYIVFPIGETTLAERIARSDVVARVRLRSVSAGSERWKFEDDPVMHVGTLEHRFEVLEYLKGSGTGEIVALAYGPDLARETSELAAADGTNLLGRRDTRWDAREAIVFLEADHEWMPDLPKAGRYLLGSVWATRGVSGDYYSINSRSHKNWLPAADAAAGGASETDGTKRFLLAAPRTDGAAGQTDTPTITLDDLMAQIARIVGDVTAGGGSDAYEACLNEKNRLAREVSDALAVRDGVYPTIPFKASIGSGQAAGTQAYLFSEAWPDVPLAELIGNGEYRVIGRDGMLFAPQQQTGAFETARPLPSGEYKFNPYYIDNAYKPCEAMPEELKTFYEVTVTVTAPSGTVHEAFFDLLVGAAGVPLPSDFTVGGAGTAIHWLEWRDGTVLLLMAPYVDLKGHTLDFIALNGTVVLSLDAGAATADPAAGTLTWAVASQPWREGDELMLRIRKGAAGPTGTPTPPPTPTPTPAPPPTAEPPIRYAPAWQPTGAHPGGYARWLWKIAPSTFEERTFHSDVIVRARFVSATVGAGVAVLSRLGSG